LTGDGGKAIPYAKIFDRCLATRSEDFCAGKKAGYSAASAAAAPPAVIAVPQSDATTSTCRSLSRRKARSDNCSRGNTRDSHNVASCSLGGDVTLIFREYFRLIAGHFTLPNELEVEMNKL
jgi:hypothetical protein